jgi:DNA-binding MarR family transcriptional regulator
MYIHLFAMNGSSLPALPCLCATLRRSSRALTQHYDEALRPLGLRATQFTVLQALQQTGEISQGKLQHGWVAKRRGKDRREWRLRLAQAGTAQLDRALPVWQKVQARLRQKLGAVRWNSLFHLTNEVTSAVTE